MAGREGTLVGLYFQPLTSQDIMKRSVSEVKSVKNLQHQMYGLPNHEDLCSTCGAQRTKAGKNECPGHSGRIELPVLVYHQDRISSLLKILNRICTHCHLMKQTGPRPKKRKKRVDERRSARQRISETDQVVPDDDDALSHCSRTKPAQSALEVVPDSDAEQASAARVFEAEEEEINEPEDESPDNCSVCSGPKWSARIIDKQVAGAAVPTMLIEIDRKMKSKDIPPQYHRKLVRDETFTAPWRSKFLPPREALWILECAMRKLDDEEKQSLDLRAPEDYFMQTLFVPPNWMRYTSEEFYLQDEVSKAQKSLVNRIKSMLYVRNDQEVSQLNEQQHWELQNFAAQCLRANPLHTKGSSSADAQSGLKFMRSLTGKVGSSCARAVIRGDPFLKVEEIGVPFKMAADLVLPVAVTNFNIKQLQEINKEAIVQVVRNGKHFKHSDGPLKLEVGDVLYRRLRDGDQVFVNRPPTFHKHALIGLTVKVLKDENVFSINPLICPPLFADFDGDALHAFLPQSLEVKTELLELMTVSKQLISSQGGMSIIGLMQDSLLGAHLLTRKDVFLGKADVDQLQMWCCSEAPVPVPAIIKSPKRAGPLWTGRQVFGMTLSKDVDYQNADGSVIIRQGELLKAESRSSSWLGSKGLVTSICYSAGPDAALQHLNSAQSVSIDWILERGFSVGLSDFYLAADTNSRRKLDEEILCALEEAKISSLVHQTLSDAHIQMNSVTKPREFAWNDRFQPCTRRTTMQQAAISGFQSVMSGLERTVKVHGSRSHRDNSLLQMVDANSKGSLSKIVQQGACLGLQLLQGDFLFERVKSVFPQAAEHELDGRFTSSELWKSMGLVESSFLEGLDPREFFVQAIATRTARAGLQEVGGLFRFLTAFLKDVRVEYDMTVRSTHGSHILQFSYPGNEVDSEPGTPVGILAATGIIEPIYDQVLSSSHQVSANKEHPLQTLKDILQPCSNALRDFDRRVTLKLSPTRSLKPEWIALKVQDHLLPITLRMLTSRISIEYDPADEVDGLAKRVPWIGCLELQTESLRRCGLTVDSIVSHFHREPTVAVDNGPVVSVHFYSRSSQDHPVLCFFPILATVNVADNHHELMWNTMFPVLLDVAVKGCDCLESVTINFEHGELVLNVVVKHAARKRGGPWNVVISACESIMELIDWKRSSPFSVQEVCSVFGIEAACSHLLAKLKQLAQTFDRVIRDEHSMLIADVACHTGEVDGFMASGYEDFLKKICQSSPLALATAKNPGGTFEAAAMERASDSLDGVIESVFCGKRPSLGTGADFDLFIKEDETMREENVDFETFLVSTETAAEKGRRELWSRTMALFHRLSKLLKDISADMEISPEDQKMVLEVLNFHPESENKIGCGVKKVTVGNHRVFSSRCFYVVRADDTTEDFSYRKCLRGMLRGDSVLVERYDKYIQNTNTGNR